MFLLLVKPFLHAADPHGNFVPQIIPSFTPAYLLLFFNAVFCFFFHYKSNTISLEVYANQTHYHIYKYFQSVSSCFPQGPMQIGVISKAGPEVEIFERVSGDGLS